MAISEGWVYSGQPGTGAATVIQAENINPAQIYLASIKEEKARQAAEAEARAKSNAEFAKRISDFNATGWYRDDSDIAKSVQGVKDRAMNYYRLGINPFDPKNAEAYADINSEMGKVKSMADYSTQHKDRFDKDINWIREHEKDIDPKSREEYESYWNQPLKDRMKSDVPTLRVIPKKTHWVNEFLKEKKPSTIGIKKEDGEFVINNVSANTTANKIQASNYIKNHPDKDKMMQDMNMTEDELINTFSDALNAEANTVYSKLSKDGGFDYYHGYGDPDDNNPYGLGNENINLGQGNITAKNAFYINEKAMPSTSGITIHSNTVHYLDEGKTDSQFKGDFKFIPEGVISLPTYKGKIVTDSEAEGLGSKIVWKQYVRGTGKFQVNQDDIRPGSYPGAEPVKIGEKQVPREKAVLIPLDESVKGKMNTSLKGFKKWNDEILNNNMYKPKQPYTDQQLFDKMLTEDNIEETTDEWSSIK